MIEQQRQRQTRRVSAYGALPLHPHAPPLLPRTYPTVSPQILPYKPPHISRPLPIAASPQSIIRPATTAPSTVATVGMSYHRPLSPGGRKIQNPARASDSFADPYYAQGRHNSYTSPRTSSGVIPISSQTFVSSTAGQPVREQPRTAERYDAYSGRPRRSSLIDTQRGAAPVTQMPSRSRPTVVQNDIGRPSSPLKGTTTTKEYYVTPASSAPRKTEHKKLYSVDAGTAKLVADVNVPVDRHRRRESVERGGAYRGLAPPEKERDRGRRDYHANGTRTRDKSIDDADAFSYTDAAGMYRDTEWREARPRRGSMDRGGASRERPVSMLEPYGDPRASVKDIGPPPSTRGWDKLTEGVGRTRSVRDAPPARNIAQSPSRGRYGDSKDPYYVPPRASSREGRPRANSKDTRSLALHHDRPVERYDPYASDNEPPRESRRHERRNSVTRKADPSLERRGFGIRADSKDRYGRGSDESFENGRQGYRDSSYVEPHRRDTAPEVNYHEIARLEQEKKDREIARLQAEERDRLYEREKRRDDDRGYDREYDRPRDRERDREGERETERERERQRMMERNESERDRDRDRHHNRRGTADRDYRKENGSKDEGFSQSGLAKAATGGLAGAAAAFGLNKVFNKDKDKSSDDERERERVKERERKDRERERDKEREREREREQEREREREKEKEKEKERDRERERERERQREVDREAERQRYVEPPREKERDRRRHGPDSHSDDPAPFERERERERPRDADRGLGFAFEAAPEPPKAAQPERRERDRQRDREADKGQDRAFEREHEDVRPTAEMPKPAVDADEDYRRRMEQVQRELGHIPDDRQSTDSDPDRERRRREREARQRERDELREPKLDAGIGLTGPFNEQPPPPALRRSFDNDSVSTGPSSAAGEHGLRRRPSILDQPMMAEPSQIIDNSLSDRRENRVRIVDPPTEEEDRRPKGILKRPTQKFPEHPNEVREGVAPLKDATKTGIPPGARWTKIDRKLVNPEALEDAKERFEERMDCVIVLRVLTKEEIQKLADRTREIRDQRYEEDRSERKARRRERHKDRKDKDEYSDDSENEFAEKAPRMLEAPSTAGASSSDADFIRENRDRRSHRDAERDVQYMSGGLGRREDGKQQGY
ncbi:hypothetical protein LTR85_002299 [Meristemomyces frigidus]|nr:hypothetical protein LTR85_002299 [Meristemomyces frigidus]